MAKDLLIFLSITNNFYFSLFILRGREFLARHKYETCDVKFLSVLILYLDVIS